MTLPAMPRCTALALVAIVSLSTHARAATPDTAEQPPEGRAARSAEAGMFLPYTMAPRTDSQRAFAFVLGGYDSPREHGQLEGTADLTVWGPLAVRIGVLYGQTSDQLRPSAGLRVQALSQASQGVDLSLGAFYRPEGFTEMEGEVEFVAAVARTFGHLGMFANLVYGQDPEGAERDAELRLAGLYAFDARFFGGIDSRLRFDLGEEEGKLRSEGEAEFDLVAGPTVMYALGEVALIAQVGVSGVGFEQSPRWGVVALGGLGGSL
jgi:hypothetical protein